MFGSNEDFEVLELNTRKSLILICIGYVLSIIERSDLRHLKLSSEDFFINAIGRGGESPRFPKLVENIMQEELLFDKSFDTNDALGRNPINLTNTSLKEYNSHTPLEQNYRLVDNKFTKENLIETYSLNT